MTTTTPSPAEMQNDGIAELLCHLADNDRKTVLEYIASLEARNATLEKEHRAMLDDLQSVQKTSGLLKFNTGCTDTRWQALESAIGKSLSSLTIK